MIFLIGDKQEYKEEISLKENQPKEKEDMDEKYVV